MGWLKYEYEYIVKLKLGTLRIKHQEIYTILKDWNMMLTFEECPDIRVSHGPLLCLHDMLTKLGPAVVP
jgi:hypothetical protein